MIIHRLVEYYHHQSEKGDPDFATEGFQKQEIYFVVVIDTEGNFLDIIDSRDGDSKRKRGRIFTVPKGVKRAVNIAANLLWDNVGYVLGIDTKGKPDRAIKQKEAFIERIKQEFKGCSDIGISSILAFYDKAQDQVLQTHPLFTEIKESVGNITFGLNITGLELICERPQIIEHLTNSSTSTHEENEMQYCLITGQKDEIARLHTAIKGVRGGQPAGTNIVSFNLPAFTSYNKKQSFNAPISKKAEFAYTTALNNLLGKDSRRKIQVADASTVFWATEETPMEDFVFELFGDSVDNSSSANDSKVTDPIKILYQSPKLGVPPPIEDDRTLFYVLGLAPNASRISLRFWHESTVKELAINICQHFEDLKIVHGDKGQDYPSIQTLLRETAVQRKLENIQPNLAGEVTRAILAGTLYPYLLLSATIRRIRATHHVSYLQAAIIKAILNRQSRFYQKGEQITVSLNENNNNCGYCLGRLFAILELVQERANPGINATIRDRFYGAAATTPVTVFPQLLKLKNHHIAKMENKGQGVYFEKLIGNIMDSITQFPKHLALADQGQFAIGYYHQRQNFYTKKDAN